jgi:hypothetical protein
MRFMRKLQPSDIGVAYFLVETVGVGHTGGCESGPLMVVYWQGRPPLLGRKVPCLLIPGFEAGAVVRANTRALWVERVYCEDGRLGLRKGRCASLGLEEGDQIFDQCDYSPTRLAFVFQDSPSRLECRDEGDEGKVPFQTVDELAGRLFKMLYFRVVWSMQ